MFAGLSWEVLKRHALQQLLSYPGWVVAGLAGPVGISVWLLARPGGVREVFGHLQVTLNWLVAWYALFTVCWCVFHWLRPEREDRQPGLEAAPLPALQYFLHRSAGLAMVPLTALVLTLPLFLVMLLYTGDPYGSESGRLVYSVRAGWEWGEFPNPWGLRMLFTGLNLAAATLIPLALGLLLQETVVRRWGRIVVQAAFVPALWYVVSQAEYDYVRTCYKQTRGHDPWVYAVTGLVLLVLPFLLGWLRRRGRAVLGVVLALVVVSVACLPFLAGIDSAWIPRLRDALGDGRFALAYFAGHLQPALNIDMLMHSFQSTVLLDDHLAGNVIPRRVALWVGAGLYPVLLPVAGFILLGLGIGLSRRHPTE